MLTVSPLSSRRAIADKPKIINETYPPNLGEPLNAILSADSDSAVLQRTDLNGGFLNYMLCVVCPAATP